MRFVPGSTECGNAPEIPGPGQARTPVAALDCKYIDTVQRFTVFVNHNGGFCAWVGALQQGQ